MAAPYARKLGKLLTPLAGCLILGGALYFAGTTYQDAGAEALAVVYRVLGYALSIGLILFAALFVHRLVQVVVLEGLVTSALGEPVPRLLVQLSGMVVFGIAFAAIAGYVFKQDLTVLWAASGVLGVVLGMAIREPLLDICSGLALNLDRPIRIGDHIRLHRMGDITVEGRVQEISWRSTRIQDDFRNIIVVPNSRLAAATITNHSRPGPFIEFMTTVILDHGAPTERALRILEAAALEAWGPFAVPGAAPPYIRVRAATLDGVDYGIYFEIPVEKRFRARSMVLQKVLEHLDVAGLRPAWPKGERSPGDPATRAWRDLDAARIAQALAGTALFGGLPDGDVRVLAENARLRRLPAGATLVQAGEAAAALYVVLEGLLTVEPVRGRTGQGEPPRDAGPGSVVGAVALFQGTTYAETARGRTEALVVELGLEAIRALVTRRPESAEELSRQVAALVVSELRGRAGGRRSVAAEADLAADVLAHIRRATGVQPVALVSGG
ncbi:mechanosensitive ion channel family protein [Azospirillum sp. TSO22-1]|uniref:mechanosensitive ion channel family protein n=1 Tax=Azospirillum sp. TSO22-1 TaxID=716789 RepID=UPI000D612CDE|nr:mechanosensitive ion channel family protein [Azospirillum sp. TSO22-1]PWC52744.1 hypothetical protein TSO221_13190 [Azospirillum sp. TSO22-1]